MQNIIIWEMFLFKFVWMEWPATGSCDWVWFVVWLQGTCKPRVAPEIFFPVLCGARACGVVPAICETLLFLKLACTAYFFSLCHTRSTIHGIHGITKFANRAERNAPNSLELTLARNRTSSPYETWITKCYFNMKPQNSKKYKFSNSQFSLFF